VDFVRDTFAILAYLSAPCASLSKTCAYRWRSRAQRCEQAKISSSRSRPTCSCRNGSQTTTETSAFLPRLIH